MRLHTEKHSYDVEFIDEKSCNLKLLFKELKKIDSIDISQRFAIVNDKESGQVGILIKKMKYEFEYSKSMQLYRKEENIENEMKSIEISSTKAKMPYFSYDLVTDIGTFRQYVRTRKLNDTTFQVLVGNGQASDGIFRLVG
ncbi:MAG: hypothetical protein LBH78_03515 [Rickettsiales bacterium]|nr:hypothetical protein [Rickettsiales bacterium]